MNNLFEEKGMLPWQVKTLCNMMAKEKIVFDSYVQRHLVWKLSDKGWLMHSALLGYPVPPIYTSESNGIYDCMDGKQRSNAFYDFINNQYALDFSQVDMEEDINLIKLEDGSVFEAEGLKFEELPFELQNRITTYGLNIYWYRNMTDEQKEEMILRLNGGRSFSAIEITRIRAKSFEIIKELAEHPIFDMALTEKGKEKYNNEDIVIKSYITIFSESPSHMTKDIRAFISNVEITGDQAKTLRETFDKILSAYNSIEKTASKIAKRMLRKVHFTTLVKLASKVSLSELIVFVTGFFDGKNRAATVNDSYNRNCTAGSAKPESVARRLVAMDDFFKGNDAETKIAEIKAQALATAAQKPEPTSEPEVEAELEADSDVDPDYDTSFPTLADIEQKLHGIDKEDAEADV